MSNTGKPVRIPPAVYDDIKDSKAKYQSFGSYIAFLVAEVKRLTAENLTLKRKIK